MALKADGSKSSIGVIGGSGLYDIEGLKGVRDVRIRTPFGSPSDAIRVGRLDGVSIAFLSRHGRGHRLNPGEINYRETSTREIACSESSLWRGRGMKVD
jgi:5'-methylthioadenosine phosphorylase